MGSNRGATHTLHRLTAVDADRHDRGIALRFSRLRWTSVYPRLIAGGQEAGSSNLPSPTRKARSEVISSDLAFLLPGVDANRDANSGRTPAHFIAEGIGDGLNDTELERVLLGLRGEA